MPEPSSNPLSPDPDVVPEPLEPQVQPPIEPDATPSPAGPEIDQPGSPEVGPDGWVRVRCGNAFGVDWSTVFMLNADHFCANARCNFAHALAEQAVDGDHRNVARINGVHERGFHASRSRRAQRQGAGVLGSPESAQAIGNAIHACDELRIQMPQQRQAPPSPLAV